jgi:pyridoxamine 5'-phosphate oxidase
MDLNLNGAPLPPNPLELFDAWYAEYFAKKPKEPTAMIVATASPQGIPSARTVLLKSHDKNGFVFFTNYESNKAKDLEINKWAQLLFYWETLARQVRILGQVEKISNEDSNAYFASRPYLSQIGAWASSQSRKIESRDVLLARTEELKKKYPEGHVPRPPNWGGYSVKPVNYEFWIGRENRLHDRFLYEKQNEGWQISRLSP